MELGEMKEATSLTALERELIDYIERLATAFETSSNQFKSLEARSSKMIYAKQEKIETSLALLIESQASLVSGLITFVRNSELSETLPQALTESQKAIQEASEIIKAEALVKTP